MYKILLLGKRMNNKTFKTYDDARIWVRKQIRKTYDPATRFWDFDDSNTEFCYYNPALNAYGISIKRIA